MKNKELIEKMTLEEKAALLSGKGEWQTWNLDRLGIPSMYCSDGPHGIRRQAGAGDHLGLNPSLPATCFPTAATMANSWDPELGEEIGQALGEEAKVQGVHVVLGPGLNIKRSPLCGRNFEYFSEDPYLSGKVAAGYIRGIQSQGRYACPKHFAVNSQELRRMAMNAVVDERTLREIYLTGFEIAIKEGGAKALMTSYNQVNGTYCRANCRKCPKYLVLERAAAYVGDYEPPYVEYKVQRNGRPQAARAHCGAREHQPRQKRVAHLQQGGAYARAL